MSNWPWCNGHALPLLESYFLMRPAKHAETPATRAFSDWMLEQVGA